MSKIIEVKKASIDFLRKEINCYDPKAIKIEKVNENWEVVAEVYEDDTFLKSLNLPPKKVRLFYSVSLDDKLDIIAYKRLKSFEDMDAEV